MANHPQLADNANTCSSSRGRMRQTKGKYRSTWRTGRETDQLNDQHNSEQVADQATDRLILLIAAINQIAEKINNAAERVETALVASRVERARDVVKQIR